MHVSAVAFVVPGDIVQLSKKEDWQAQRPSASTHSSLFGHVKQEEDPGLSVYSPAGHFSQFGIPTLGATSPGLHCAQATTED